MASITLGEWIKELDTEAGISAFTEEKPYFMNVPKENDYYPYVQAAVEWKILAVSYAFDPQQPLNKEWTAYTLMNLVEREQSQGQKINDLDQSSFPEQIKAAVSSGLMPLDQRGMFHPEKIMAKEEAEQLLKQSVSYANHQTCPDIRPDVQWDPSISMQEIQPQTFNERTLEAEFAPEAYLQVGGMVHWHNTKGMDVSYIIAEIQQEDDRIKAQLKEYAPEDHIDAIKVSGQQELDFSQASIEPGDAQVLNQAAVPQSAATFLTDMAVHSLKKEFSVGGFLVSLECTGSSLRAAATRTMNGGTEIAASAMVNHVNVNYAWDSLKKDLLNAYFRIDFDSEEDLSVQNRMAKNLYGDLSQIKAQDFLSTLQNLYQAKNDAQEATITLCRIVLPVPNAPVLNLTMDLDLHLSTSGKAELTLQQENSLGFEIREGRMRLIKENTGKADASMKATTKILAGIRFGLGLLNGTLMDAGVNAGAQGTVMATAHLYDNEGNMSTSKTDLPGDVCDNGAEGNPDVLICTDIDAHWVLDVLLNSQKSLAGKFGVTKEFDILDGDNAPLIPGMNRHYENGKAVDHCTRRSRHYLPSSGGITTAKRICLEKYSYVVNENEIQEIVVEALPEGYSLADLVYESNNERCVVVDDGGCMHGKEAGSSVITIETKDHVHVIHCNVIVPQKE